MEDGLSKVNAESQSKNNTDETAFPPSFGWKGSWPVTTRPNKTRPTKPNASEKKVSGFIVFILLIVFDGGLTVRIQRTTPAAGGGPLE